MIYEWIISIFRTQTYYFTSLYQHVCIIVISSFNTVELICGVQACTVVWTLFTYILNIVNFNISIQYLYFTIHYTIAIACHSRTQEFEIKFGFHIKVRYCYTTRNIGVNSVENVQPYRFCSVSKNAVTAAAMVDPSSIVAYFRVL